MKFRKKLVSFSKKEIDDGEYWLIANKLALRDEEGRIVRINHIDSINCCSQIFTSANTDTSATCSLYMIHWMNEDSQRITGYCFCNLEGKILSSKEISIILGSMTSKLFASLLLPSRISGGLDKMPGIPLDERHDTLIKNMISDLLMSSTKNSFKCSVAKNIESQLYSARSVFKNKWIKDLLVNGSIGLHVLDKKYIFKYSITADDDARYSGYYSEDGDAILIFWGFDCHNFILVDLELGIIWNNINWSLYKNNPPFKEIEELEKFT